MNLLPEKSEISPLDRALDRAPTVRVVIGGLGACGKGLGMAGGTSGL